jgi:HK97 family phage portal protein
VSRGLFGSIAAGLRGEFLNEVKIEALLAKYFGLESKSGKTVNVENALGVTTVLACTRALAEPTAQIPIKVLQEDSSGRKKTVARAHPAHKVLAYRPNEWMDSFQFRETMMYHAGLTGDGIAVKNVVRGTLRELIPVAPENRRIRRDTDHSVYCEIVDEKGGRIAELPASQFFHLRGPSWNSYKGLEIIRVAREAIGLSIAAEENHALLHRNGSRVGGILTTEKGLGDADIARIRTLWEQKTTGIAGSYGTRVLDKGLKYERLGMSGVDSEHLATREHQIREICMAMKVLPIAIGFADKTATYASAEAFFTAYVKLCLEPWFTRWQHACTSQLLTEREFEQGYFVKMFSEGLLKGDHRARAAFYQVMVLTGILTRNECRVLEDMDPLAGLDEPLVPLNMMAVGDVPADPNLPADQQAASIIRMPNVPLVPSAVAAAVQKLMQLGSEHHNVGRILSSENERLIRGARDDLSTVLDKLSSGEDDASVTED